MHKSAPQVHYVLKAVAFERARGKIPALAFLAIDQDFPVMGQFVQVIAEFVERDINRPGKPSEFNQFVLVPDVEKEFAIWLHSWGETVEM